MDNDNHTTMSPDLKASVIAKLKQEAILPHSRVYFQAKESWVWLLWFLSVMVGAVAFAVSFYVISSRQYSLHEATHENLVSFILDIAPYWWLGVLILVIVVAWYQLRHTKCGYRLSILTLVLASLVLSVILGSVFYSLGAGFMVDQTLGTVVPNYTSQAKLERGLWQQPPAGRLVGQVSTTEVAEAGRLAFIDVSGQLWQLDISELQAADLGFIADQSRVKIIGLPPQAGSVIFHACGVFPWIYHRNQPHAKLTELQKRDRERMRRHLQTKLDDIVPAPADGENKSSCSQLPMLGRLQSSGQYQTVR